jgi:hypothetical protein
MYHSGASRREKAKACVRITGWLHLAPLAGRGPRRSAAEDRGEGDYPRVRTCRESPSPARKMLATSPRKRGEVKNGDASHGLLRLCSQ